MISREPDETAVEVLERWLVDARAGLIDRVAIAGVTPDGRITTAFSKGDRVAPLIAATAMLHYRASRFVDDEASEPWPGAEA